MALRIATFNVENLMARFDFSGFRNELRRDRTISMLDIKDEAQYRDLEQARVVAHADDTRQMTALAITDTNADIVCLQEVENIDTLHAFEYGYLFKMAGAGYRQKFLIEGNDGRGIDVALMAREETRDGAKIEVEGVTSHAHLTYGGFDLHNKDLDAMGQEAHERIFRRDCLEVDVRIGGLPFTIFVCHFKSMGPFRDGKEGRQYTMPVREAEARAVRKIIENRFGAGRTNKMRWMICGDLNDYRSKLTVAGDQYSGYRFENVAESRSGIDALFDDDFSVNLVERRKDSNRWTLYHSRGPKERHLVQLDYLLASPELARVNAKAVPDIVRNGQPYRTIFPKGQNVDRYPRTGWDRPKASDHCPVAVTVNLV